MFLDNVKEMLFGKEDKVILHEPQIIEKEKHDIATYGFQSKLLHDNPIFQKVVLDKYTNLLGLEDTLDPMDPDVNNIYGEFRLQRRILKNLVISLDDNIFAMEEMEKEAIFEAEDTKEEGNFQ